ncbi:hypothetical protein GRJ2_001836000 [Grus japonensis]|uniref:Uncharacterized protein n=1 Tax=Grus japonensis TaxID=30415 RepID=A0ABC9XAD5_GRUJA
MATARHVGWVHAGGGGAPPVATERHGGGGSVTPARTVTRRWRAGSIRSIKPDIDKSACASSKHVLMCCVAVVTKDGWMRRLLKLDYVHVGTCTGFLD